MATQILRGAVDMQRVLCSEPLNWGFASAILFFTYLLLWLIMWFFFPCCNGLDMHQEVLFIHGIQMEMSLQVLFDLAFAIPLGFCVSLPLHIFLGLLFLYIFWFWFV